MNYFTKALLYISTCLLSASCLEKPAPWVPPDTYKPDSSIELRADNYDSKPKDTPYLPDIREAYDIRDAYDTIDDIFKLDISDVSKDIKETLTDVLLDKKEADDTNDTHVAEISDIVKEVLLVDALSEVLDVLSDKKEAVDTKVATEVEDIFEINVPVLLPYLPDDNCVALLHLDNPDYLLNLCGPFNLEEKGSILTTSILSVENFGDARHFDGESVLFLPHYPPLDPSYLTIDAMVRPSKKEHSYTDDRGWIVNKAACPVNGPCTGYGLYLTDASTLVAILGITQTQCLLELSYDFSLEEFTHLRFIFDGLYMRLFINEEMKAEKIAAGMLSPSIMINVGIGGEPYAGFTNRFIGDIDEVRISNIVRTD